MGPVRKLAMFVVIGLIAISTAVTVYTANEPNRRGDETSEQQGVSVERATSLYVTYCLQCHGPAGLGNMEVDADGNNMGRVGAPLNQSLMSEEDLQARAAIFQTDDPVEQAIAEDWIRFRIMYGAPSEGQLNRNYNQVPAMPAFRQDLNVEEINSLVWLIMHGDWNYVYNQAVHYTGQAACEATPEAEREESCDHAVAYPTVVPTPDPEGESPGAPVDAGAAEEAGDDINTGDTDDVATPGAESDQTGSDQSAAGDQAGATDHAVTSVDIDFDTESIEAKPGDTITLTNEGFAQHDLVVDELGIATDLLNNGQTMTITIPEDAAPGEYEFYCSVPGHKEAGMVGTLTITEP